MIDPLSEMDRPAFEAQRQPRWLAWVLLIALCVLAFESLLLATVNKGPWLVMLAPMVFCSMRARDLWRCLRR